MLAAQSNQAPRPLLILGRPPNASDLALRRILHAKDAKQPLAVIDYQGSLAAQLTKRNKGNLHRSALVWCDVTNRRRPTALFRFASSPWLHMVLTEFLTRITKYLAQPVSSATIDAAAALAVQMTAQGTIGLSALARGLKRPELAQQLRRTKADAAQCDCLSRLLDWLLRFPGVWAMTEGNNGLDLARAVANSSTIWLEMFGTHFERVEHQIVSWMVDAAVFDAMMTALAKNEAKGNGVGAGARAQPVLLYGYPSACPLSFQRPELPAKHVGLFGLSASMPMSDAALQWNEVGADCWVAGDVGDVPVSYIRGCFDETERSRIRGLTQGQVWVRSGADHKAVTTLVRVGEPPEAIARAYRYQAQTRLKLSPVKQYSSAFTCDTEPGPANADLYSVLCSKATLYAGWFRVKSHNRRSHGLDRVTIAQFGETLDVELDRLVSELVDGRYRGRPLRTVRIPKSDGDMRIIRIACVRDRVVQAACLHLIEPLFDARFSAASFAYRPGRGAQHAVALARSAIRSGKHHIVTADIRKCFDNVDHEILLRLVGDVVGDRDILRLLRQWLTADVIDFMDIFPTELGVPQGEAISPLLANIYLDPMDKEFERAGVNFVRYADDYLVLCETEAQAKAALSQMREFLQGVLCLELKPAKTQVAHITDGVEFLGFDIRKDDVRIPEQKIARTLDAVMQHLLTLGAEDCASDDQWRAAIAMNALIRGFRNYFLIEDAPSVRAQLGLMDEAIQALAGSAITANSRLELVWSSRERFLPSEVIEEMKADAADAATAVSGTYLDTRTSADLDRTSLGSIARSTTIKAGAQASSADGGRAGTITLEGPASDVAAIDGRLHVLGSGCFVSLSGESLTVRRHKAEIARVDINNLAMLYLEGKGIGVSADLTMQLCERDIPVVFTPLIGRPVAIAQSIQSLRSGVRQQQVLLRNDPTVLRTGMTMLAAKVGNQASVLKYFARYRKKLQHATFEELTRCADELRQIAATIESLDPTAAGARATAMGHEGRAAAKYWSAIGALMPEGFAYNGRVTRHATDPFNSAINYIYSMLYGEVWRAVVRAGLDPYFGVMHGTDRDQGSLVFDLIEEYRAPFGDRLVLALLGRGFELELDKSGLLRTSCRHKLVTAFHKQWRRDVRAHGKMRSPPDILELQATSMRNMYLGKNEYKPFRFRW